MNKLSRIHLAKVSYDIETEAESRLSQYLAALKESLEPDTAQETMTDIETRITEILSTLRVEKNDVITDENVTAIIKQLGNPEDFREAPHAQPAPAATPVRRWRSVLIVGGVVAAVIALGAIWYAWPVGLTQENQEQVYQQKISRLEVKANSGHFDISPSDGDAITLERTLKWNRGKPTFKEEWEGETLRITTHCPDRNFWLTGNNCELGYTLRVPKHITIDLQLEAGNVDIRNITGDIRLGVASGNVTVTGGQGTIAANINAGSFTGNDLASSNVDTKIDAGHIDLRFKTAPASVIARIASGNADILLPYGESYKVEAETSSGTRNVTVQQNSESPYVITARTSSGNVTVAHPNN